MLTQHGEFADTILGTILLFVGVAACCIAAFRGGNSRRILESFGIVSALWGVRMYAEVPGAFSLLAGPFSPYAPQVAWISIYVLHPGALLLG